VGNQISNNHIVVKQYEIWGGKAYCLQREDSHRVQSVGNTFPNVKALCSSSVLE
jgi:hypothetical protein